ncbi:DNA cytosine methyltransferase [Microcoleus sp. LAD1_D5]|uniref:DNA cytosine methyltransferase n=1 Tax=Microcoleus sp. LAD1_D5 TaxID=2818813 RepID=UPI004040C3F0
MLKQIDLCTGVGAGFALAGLRSGFRLAGLAEIDPFCSHILKLRYPGIPNYGDIKQFKETWQTPQSVTERTCTERSRSSRSIDLVSASPACQPFSYQGNRLGQQDPRDCIPYVREIIEEIKPSYWALENVPGLLSIHRGNYFRFSILNWANNCGYDVEWITVGSGHIGSPYFRKRLLILGISRSLGGGDIRSKPAWADQIRGSIKTKWIDRARGSFQPGIFRGELGAAHWLDRSTGRSYSYGTPSGDRTTRHRRKALGNLFDPRVASLAVDRILYHHTQALNKDRDICPRIA